MVQNENRKTKTTNTETLLVVVKKDSVIKVKKASNTKLNCKYQTETEIEI